MDAVSKKDLGGFRGNLQFGQELSDGGSFFHFHHAGVFAVLIGEVIFKGGVKDKFDFHTIRSIRLWATKKVHQRKHGATNIFASGEMTRSRGGLMQGPSGISFSPAPPEGKFSSKKMEKLGL